MLYNIYTEGKLNKAERDKLPDSEFGLPKTRQFPLHDKEHVLKAIQMFHRCPEEHRKELAHNIKRKADQYGITISEKSLVYKYLSNKSSSKEKDVKNESSIFRLNFFNGNEKLSELNVTNELLESYSIDYPKFSTVCESDENYKSLMVVEGNSLVGYASKNLKSDRLLELEVNPLYEHQGIGSQLLQDINPKYIKLAGRHKKLKEFFKKNGFIMLNETPNQLVMIKENENDSK